MRGVLLHPGLIDYEGLAGGPAGGDTHQIRCDRPGHQVLSGHRPQKGLVHHWYALDVGLADHQPVQACLAVQVPVERRMFAGVLEQAPEADELAATGRRGGQSCKPHAVGVVAD